MGTKPQIVSDISETNFEQLFSEVYKIKTPVEAKVDLNDFLSSGT
jgi:hypothetical protein